MGDIGPRAPRALSIPALGALEPLLELSNTLRRCSMVVRFLENELHDNRAEKAEEFAVMAEMVEAAARKWRERNGGELQVQFE